MYPRAGAAPAPDPNKLRYGMTDIAGNLGTILDRIRQAERLYQRIPGSVQLLAVSKSRTADEMRAAMAADHHDFGENYLQEALSKMAKLEQPGICWHFIGPIQSNKCRAIAERFSWVHSLDRIKIARRLNDLRPEGTPALQVCIEINISSESSKSGIRPADLPAFAAAVSALPRLRLRGLMTMPRPSDEFASQRVAFRRLHDYFVQLNASDYAMDTLSMGTTGDMEAAIAEGSTMVRVGTAIFGQRP